MQSDDRSVKRDEVDDLLVQASPPKRLLDYVFFQASPEVTHEQGQCLARIAISSAVAAGLAALWWGGFRGAPGHWIFTWITAAYAAFGILYYAVVRRFRERFLWRRYVMIVADLGLASAGTYVFGLSGVGFYPVFLWVTIGNGLRFGPHLLRVAVAVGVTAFLIATWLNGTLLAHPAVVVGLLVGLLLMPKFFLVMIQRLAAANEVLRQEKQQAEYRAMHDELTGLPSRALLQDRLELALRKLRRHAGRLAVVFIDLDGFKAINDNFGHKAGDRLLQQLAGCLQQQVRAADTVARLGGDEFIVLVEDCGTPEDVVAVVEQLSKCVGRYYGIDGHYTFINWSCGAAIYPEDGTDAGSLIKHADTAMYRAKADGEGGVRFYNRDMTELVARQLVFRDDLHRALEAQQFEVHYQPVVRLDGGEIIDVEALLRWRHPQRGLLEAAHFIPTAEQSGLVIELGQIAMAAVLGDMAGWRRRGLAFGRRVYLNVSPRQLGDPGFAAELLSGIDGHGLLASDIGLDLGESALFTDSAALRQVLSALHEQGIGLALDDFGSGYSALAHLRDAPVERIKIDRVFLRGTPQDRRNTALVEAILAFGARLDLEVVAEGVETAAQREWLQQAGCCLAQGRLYGGPLAGGDFAVELARAAKRQKALGG